MKPQSFFRNCLILTALLILATALKAGPLDGSCVVGPQPAASLLLPYFEVDLEKPDGATTLMSIGNRAEQATLARVVLWSDWAIPVYAFDVLVPARGLQTLNLRDLVARGNLPVTGGGIEPMGSCTAPLSNPPLDAPALATLHAQLTGKPATVDGLCWGSDRGDTSVAVGYVTVDVLTDCSDTVRTPVDAGYFATDGTGLAGYDNVLYGDWFLIDPSQDLAQGAELVHLVADRDFFADGMTPSFYHVFTEQVFTADARIPLSSHWQTRFLNGGGFDGGTEFLLWHEPAKVVEPVICGDHPFGCVFRRLFYSTRDEAGNGSPNIRGMEADRMTRRVHIDSLQVAGTSGLLEIQGGWECCICSPPISLGGTQSWVIPLFSAAHRFSVGSGAIRLDDPCVEP